MQQVIDYYKNLIASGERVQGVLPHLGNLYYFGARGTPQDFVEAASLYGEAATQVGPPCCRDQREACTQAHRHKHTGTQP